MQGDKRIATLAVFTSEPLVERRDGVFLTRSKWTTLSLQTEVFPRVLLCLPWHAAAAEPDDNLLSLPSRYEPARLYEFKPTSPWGWAMRMAGTARTFLRNYKEWDVVYARLFFWDGLVAALLSILLLRPMYVSVHGDIEESIDVNWQAKGFPRFIRSTAGAVLSALTKWICRRADVVFTSGPALAEKYAPGRADAVPFLETAYSMDDIKYREDAFTGYPVRLLYVGELVDRKGIDHLLRSVSILSSSKLEVELRLVGAGDHGRFSQLATELGVSDRVVFCGYVPFGHKLFAEYDQADIFVLPPIGTEGWSRVFIEANSRGLPVVTTDVGSLGRAAREYGCGLVIEPGSAQAIADAVGRIVTDGALRRRLIAGGLRRAEFHTREREEQRVREALIQMYPELLKDVR